MAEAALESCSGIVTDIQRFSLHDGPGIRTNVYFKGCNMHCKWCHNPETISFLPEVVVDPEKCIHCGKCAEGCYSGARREVGRVMTPEQVMAEVLLDRAYYQGGGGMTLTGGEPTCQPRFAKALLELAHKNGICRAIETNLTAPREVLLEILRLCDLLMCDFKLWDADAHEKWTGIRNDRIKENLLAADQVGIPIIVRTPVIPGINDSDEQIARIAEFAAQLRNLECYELLPYHELGLSKRLERGEAQQRFPKPSKERMCGLAELARRQGIAVRVAGVGIK